MHINDKSNTLQMYKCTTESMHQQHAKHYKDRNTASTNLARY